MVNFKGVAADVVPFSAAVFQLQSCERTVTQSERTNEDVDREIWRARKLRKAVAEKGAKGREAWKLPRIMDSSVNMNFRESVFNYSMREFAAFPFFLLTRSISVVFLLLLSSFTQSFFEHSLQRVNENVTKICGDSVHQQLDGQREKANEIGFHFPIEIHVQGKRTER